jgi:alpha-L-fucosidase 2
MPSKWIRSFAVCLVCLSVLCRADEQPSLTLWYTQPARQWVEALPIGNGRLGAMVFGGLDTERLQLNEDTLWAGGPYQPDNPEGPGALPQIRQLIFEGRYKEAADLASKTMMARPLRQMPYQTVGDLRLSFGAVEPAESYRRDLALNTAVASVSYVKNGVRFTREVFSSPVHQVIVCRLSADKPGQISFAASFSTPQQARIETEGNETLVVRGTNGSAEGIAGALKFQVRIRILQEGGHCSASSDSLTVSGADAATILIAAATSYKNYEDVSGDPEALTKEQIRSASAQSYERLKQDHIREHQRLFSRVHLDLGRTETADLPTDRRIAKNDLAADPQLAVLFFQFGRYLLICSSRPGSQPANLQGLWNESTTPPWGSKYTININTEMNYWAAESGNLSECVQPLFAMVKELSCTGARTARVTYGARGWVAHHNTDLWRASAPIDGVFWGLWPTGGAWLCNHLWNHYEYTLDAEFLREFYPVLKGAAQFFLDTLVEEPKNKWLVTCPSLSPENAHPKGTSLCAGPTMDMQILRDLFAHCIQAAEILNTDADLRAQLAAARERLAPNQIGAAGQLQEWMEDWDLQAPERHHRHISHLYGLYPSFQINRYDTPALAEAVKKSLQLRGDESTGWGLAWRLNLWARLGESRRAFQVLRMLLAPDRAYPNLFSAHPPFQIDGNFGGTAGILEMLLQSRRIDSGWEIELLGALPEEWPAGSVKGLCARGGFVVDMHWKEGTLQHASIHSRFGQPCRIRYGNTLQNLTIPKGQTFLWKPSE